MVNQSLVRNILTIGGVTLLFFLSLHLLGMGFLNLGKDITQTISLATSNPFIGLFIGLIITAILQSSSTITSLTVAAVAAGSISLGAAIPIVMGANIGTTLTSTIVSMSYVSKAKEFRRALAAGASHDIFNILVVFLVFPLEYHYGLLSHWSQQISELIHIDRETNVLSFLILDWSVLDSFDRLFIRSFGPFVTLIVAIALLFASVKIISNILYSKLVGKAEDQLNRFFGNTFRSFGWGMLLTSVIQSSSLTTSLIVPLVATGKVQLKRAFQFILGANLGTTITALLAAILKSEAAVSLAIAHFLFNFIGVILFLAVPVLSSLPTYLADKLGQVTMRYRIVGFAYILIVFFLLPFTLIYCSRGSNFLAKDKKEFPISLSRE